MNNTNLELNDLKNNKSNTQSTISEKIWFSAIYGFILFLPISTIGMFASEYIQNKSNNFDIDLFQSITTYGTISAVTILITLVALEFFTKKTLSYFQYILIGLSVCTGYLLNLSFGEFIGVQAGFLISSLLVILLNTSFIATTSKSITNTSATFWSLTLSYLIVFFLTKSSEYNLLITSISAFIIIAILMFGSHFINRKK